MTGQDKLPKRLYKYRPFSALTLDLLVSDKVYFADPATFNDPLDTKPCVQPDLQIDQLEQLLRTLTDKRITAEMTAAARTIKYRGPKTIEHIARHSRQQAERLITGIAYNATDPEYTSAPPGPHLDLLTRHIQRELLLQYEKGVLSLAERFTCPLMWSHYGDQHHGLCIGYTIPEDTQHNLFKVKYGGSRLIEASKVNGMLRGDSLARSEVDTAVLLRKAGAWRYEKEWRLLGARGLADAPLELSEVTFGTRCIDSIKHVVVKALQGREKPIKLYEMREVHGTFKLKRHSLNEQELTMGYPRRARSINECFEVLE